jgi:hypothetical protein
MKGCTFHDIFKPTKALHLLDLLANLRHSADQCARVHSGVANNRPDLRTTSQNVMRMARKTNRPNLREDVTIKSFLQDIRHSVVSSNNLQGVKVGEGFDGSNTSGKNCCRRIARKTDTHTPAQNIRISSSHEVQIRTHRTCEAISEFSQTKVLFRINDSP